MAADITYRSDGLRETAPLDIVLQAAPLAFTGEVESLDGPFWNAADGQRWFPGESVDGFTTVPYLYGVANVVVRRVLFDDTGTLSEDRVLPLYVVSDDLSLSGLETGTSVLILGTFEVFPFREGPVDVYRPILGGYSILVQTPADSDRYLPVLAEEGYPIAGDPILTRYPSGPTVDELAAVIDEYKSAERPPEGAWGGLYLITLSSDLLGPGVEPPLGAPDE